MPKRYSEGDRLTDAVINCRINRHNFPRIRGPRGGIIVEILETYPDGRSKIVAETVNCADCATRRVMTFKLHPGRAERLSRRYKYHDDYKLPEELKGIESLGEVLRWQQMAADEMVVTQVPSLAIGRAAKTAKSKAPSKRRTGTSGPQLTIVA